MPENTEFLPFHAINEFMRAEFKLSVIRDTLTNQAKLTDPCVNELNKQIKNRVSVPGFRNSDKAPALVKVLPTSKAFEKYPELVAAILSCWVESQSELREQVYTVLKTRNWPMLSEDEDVNMSALNAEIIKTWPVFPLRMDRTKLPGFYPHWFKGEDFEALYTSYNSLYPDANASIDKVSLMAVWLTLRLPYHLDRDLQASTVEESTDQPS
jgi:hypothetical protein